MSHLRNSAAFIIIFLFSSSCSTEDPAECITAFDCDEGLVCIDGYCVDDGIGNTGNTGNSGNSGNTGDSGDTGNTGNSGNSGNSGNTGDSGDTGNTGDTGNFGKDCKGIMTCIDECEPDDTSCLQDCYDTGSAAGKADYDAFLACDSNNSCAGNYPCIWEKCQEKAILCGLGGDTRYQVPYGTATLSGSFKYIVTNESSLSSNMYINKFIEGTFGTAGNLIDTTAAGTFAYAQWIVPATGSKFLALTQKYTNTILKNPMPYLIIEEADIKTGDHSVGLTATDTVQLFVAETDADGKVICRHAFGVGTINISSINTSAGAAGNVNLTGTVQLYSFAAAPIYGGDITDATFISCDPK